MPGIFGLTKKEQRAIEAAITRPAHETELRKRYDRVAPYLKKHLDKFLFDNFSEAYIKKASSIKKIGSIEYMRDIPIPLRKEDLEQFHSEGGLSVLVIAENMAWVLGVDPKFKYIDEYLRYMEQNFSKKVDEYLVKEAKDAGEREEYDNACVHFRAALAYKPYSLDAMYGYARCCRKMYENSNNEKYIGNFKAEAFDYFELVTEIHPKFAHAFYYLGYMYLNMGLYAKAKLVWDMFLAKSTNNKDKNEIKTRIKQLKDPLKIEDGYNKVLAQKWHEGIERLEPYLETNYADWWPLSYYLGIAYAYTGKHKNAITRFECVMRLNPGHLETMYELENIYRTTGDLVKSKKYKDKAALIKRGGYKENPQEDETVGTTKSLLSEKKLSKLKEEVKPKRIKRLEKKKNE